MRQTYFLNALLLSLSISAIGQDEKIQPDRPGETLTPQLTKKRYVQMEAGFEREQKNKKDYSLLHPEVTLKYGLSNRFEIRAEAVSETSKQFDLNEFQRGLKPVEFGFKARLFEEKGAIPTTSFFTQVGIPTLASKDHQTTHAIPKMRLLFESTLTDKLHLNYNIGAEWDGEEVAPKWLYTIDQEIDLSKQWEVFIEVFGYFQRAQAAQHQLDGGVTFLASRDIRIDVSAGVGLSREAPDHFISAGLSFRLR